MTAKRQKAAVVLSSAPGPLPEQIQIVPGLVMRQAPVGIAPPYPAFDREFRACLDFYRKESAAGQAIKAEHFRALFDLGWKKKASLAPTLGLGEDRRRFLPLSATEETVRQSASGNSLWRWLGTQHGADWYRDFVARYDFDDQFKAIAENVITERGRTRKLKLSRLLARLVPADAFKARFGKMPTQFFAEFYAELAQNCQTVVISLNPLDMLLAADLTTFAEASCWRVSSYQSNGPASYVNDDCSGIAFAIARPDEAYPYRKSGRCWFWATPDGFVFHSAHGNFPQTAKERVLHLLFPDWPTRRNGWPGYISKREHYTDDQDLCAIRPGATEGGLVLGYAICLSCGAEIRKEVAGHRCTNCKQGGRSD